VLVTGSPALRARAQVMRHIYFALLTTTITVVLRR
jgi:hypothetical protein